LEEIGPLNHRAIGALDHWVIEKQRPLQWLNHSITQWRNFFQWLNLPLRGVQLFRQARGDKARLRHSQQGLGSGP
jgi:hypothetical protein